LLRANDGAGFETNIGMAEEADDAARSRGVPRRDMLDDF